MKKHIYLHSSNTDHTYDLRNDDRFESVPEYPRLEVAKTHQYEYGRIVTDKNYYHILIGKIPQENCPWCNGSVELFKISEGNIIEKSKFCLHCKICGSRGPILNLNPQMEHDRQVMAEMTDLMMQQYKNRKAWDSDLINYYEHGILEEFQ